MAGIIAVYSLVIAVLLAGDMGPPPATSYSLFASVQTLGYHPSCNRSWFADLAKVDFYTLQRDFPLA